MTTRIIIEDHVVPQLLTSAIEAYEIKHQTHAKGKAKVGVETYGLLWGYVLPERNGQGKRIVSTVATVETSSLKHEDWVQPNLDSLIMKRDFFHRYWPQLELVGTFHSHPYDSLDAVKQVKGWRASEVDENGSPSGDVVHWPQIHRNLSPELPCMAHLIVTITALEKKGWATPQSLPGKEANTGYVFSSDDRKFWIKAYSSEADDQKVNYNHSSDIFLDIPSLTQRFMF